MFSCLNTRLNKVYKKWRNKKCKWITYANSRRMHEKPITEVALGRDLKTEVQEVDDPLFTGECSVLFDSSPCRSWHLFFNQFLNRTVEKSIKVHRASLNTIEGCQKPYLAKKKGGARTSEPVHASKSFSATSDFLSSCLSPAACRRSGKCPPR